MDANGFYQCGLSKELSERCDVLGYKKPTPIQMKTIPLILMGRDLIAIAETGSGKNCFFYTSYVRYLKKLHITCTYATCAYSCANKRISVANI